MCECKGAGVRLVAVLAMHVIKHTLLNACAVVINRMFIPLASCLAYRAKLACPCASFHALYSNASVPMCLHACFVHAGNGKACEPVVLVGNSLGGYACLNAAASYPELVRWVAVARAIGCVQVLICSCHFELVHHVAACQQVAAFGCTCMQALLLGLWYPLRLHSKHQLTVHTSARWCVAI